MIPLYFNCKIVAKRVVPVNSVSDDGFFFPVMYPGVYDYPTPDNAFKILCKTIESYAHIKFSHIFFNIDIDSLPESCKDELCQLIKQKFTCDNVYLRLSVAITVSEWLLDLERVCNVVGDQVPVLVCMNHDHPYLDYNEAYFHRCIDIIFPSTESGFQKVFAYTHAPELTATNLTKNNSFVVDENLGLYFSSNVENTAHVCAIYIMTLETLRYIWKNINFKGGEIGRIDWKGATYTNLKIKAYSSCREYFKHFDGYGHITGLEIIGKLELNRSYPIQFPQKNNNDICYEEIIDFYFIRWLNVFLLSIRDDLAKKYLFFIPPKKSEFIISVERTLSVFMKCYIQADIDSDIITSNESIRIFTGLRSRIYSHGNELFAQLMIEIVLMRDNTSHYLLNSLYRISPKILQVLLRFLYYKIIAFLTLIKR